jgi:hypothetical protein
MEHTGRRVAVLVALALAAATFAGTAFVVAQDSGGDDVEMTAGEEMSVLASAQEAQVRHDVKDRAWIQQMEDGEGAFEDRVEALRGDLDRVEERKAEISERVGSGEISERRAAALRAHAEARAVATNRSVQTMRTRAREKGVNTTALDELRQRASEMTGQEVRRVARNVAAGRGDVGPPEADETRRTGPPADNGSGDAGETSPEGSEGGRTDDANASGDAGGPPRRSGTSGMTRSAERPNPSPAHRLKGIER